MNIVATCISRNEVKLPIDIPFVNITSDETASPRGTIERVRMCCRLRNKAVEKALDYDPTHILMIDDYYVNQKKSIEDLIESYLSVTEDIIVGASTWIRWRQDTIRKKIRFYDTGTTPEAKDLNVNCSGIIPVKTVGACYIFPVDSWTKNRYICNNEKFEPEHVSLCKGFPTFLDLGVKFFRDDRTDVINSIPKAMRIKFGGWRRQICAK